MENIFKQKETGMLDDYDKKIFDLNNQWDERMKVVVDKHTKLKEVENKL